MSNSTVKNPVIDDNSSSKVQPSGGGRAAKEQEPNVSAASAFEEEEKLMASIKTTAETADKQALEALQGTLAETKRGTFEPELPPDVEDAGVVSPTKAAEDVVKNGSSVELPISEKEYDLAKKTKVSGKSDIKRNIFGVSSLAAMAIWVGKMLKKAHKHTLKVVFRREDGEATSH